MKLILYNFLVVPKYRIWRHTLFILAFATISYRQASYILKDGIEIVKNYIPIISLIILTVYLFTLYINIYFFVPRYLLNKKYGLYLLSLFFIIVIQISCLLVVEYTMRTNFGLNYRIQSYNILVFIQCIPASTMNMMCILATSVAVIFKYQVLENQRVSRMEQENIKSELDRLKEQISPILLSNILNKTAVLIKSNPGKAIDMLMRLGQLLRYQLYDSSRNTVLLSAEINFLKEYLKLSQLYCNRIEYEFIVEEELKRLFISPLLFIPFIQQSVTSVNDTDKTVFLQISFRTENSKLTFICQSDNGEILSKNELFAVKRRLELIYPDSYSLLIEGGKAILQLNNILEA